MLVRIALPVIFSVLLVHPAYPYSVHTRTQFDIDGDGNLNNVEIVLSGGRIVKDGSCGAGESYVGKAVLILTLANGKSTHTHLEHLFERKEISFLIKPWKIQFADYNHDGTVDFNLGQYGSCNGWSYRLFSIDPSGVVTALPLPGNEINISDNTNSTQKIELTSDGFSVIFYQNSDGYSSKFSYQWDKQQKTFKLKSKVRTDVP